MHSVLKEIYAHKQREVAALKGTSFAEREYPFVSFSETVKQHNGLGLIAEIKKASPSKGLIREDFDPVEIAREYSQLPAQGISVLTDEKYFKGHLDYLRRVKEVTQLPVLRKDFLIDPLQLKQAHSYGADLALLIVAMLSDVQLEELLDAAAHLGLECLVEVHDGAELERALQAGAKIVGVNNRDLNTFHVDMKTSLVLATEIPAGVVKVAESGISTGDDIRQIREAGFDAVLIGETFMRSKDIAATYNSLFGV